ncbi:MgtC/SapB family protein [Streptacidiphilus pinicola]|uniref:MgtC/SapB family protein n=1 Tax=Streptacidiphilus pinicola TaxID=2219663 RepID=UPI001A9F6072|nr:MgtC/SapB family protein [Streptacidiphilus pinicola]
MGLEREFRLKTAGLRTYTPFGVGAALFVLVSKFAFSDVTHAELVVLDPARVAAQIVSGLGPHRRRRCRAAVPCPRRARVQPYRG